MKGLSGRVVLITGAAGNIGQALVRRFADEGAVVVAASRSLKKAEALRRSLRVPDMVPLALDLADPKSIKTAFKDLKKTVGTPSILIANASLRDGLPGTINEVSHENFKSLFGVDVAGHFLCAREMVSALRGKPASIVFLASVYAQAGVDPGIYPKGMSPAPATYGAVKAAAIGLSRYMAGLWGRQGVRVNAIAAGGVGDPKLQKSEFVKNYVRKTMLGRMARREEIADAAAFLASDEASYITGACLAVDGGFLAW